MASDETRTRRFSRAEYDRLIEIGLFDEDEHIELIGGQLMVMEPKGAPHYTATRKTAKALEAAFGPGWDVRTEGPIGLDDESEPEPDGAGVPGGPGGDPRAARAPPPRPPPERRPPPLMRIPRVRYSPWKWPSRASLLIGSARAVSTLEP